MRIQIEKSGIERSEKERKKQKEAGWQERETEPNSGSSK
jgi:hypothetical protein